MQIIRMPTACPFCEETNYYYENQTSYQCTSCNHVVQLTSFQVEKLEDLLRQTEDRLRDENQQLYAGVMDALNRQQIISQREKLDKLNNMFSQAEGLRRCRRFDEAENMYRELLVQSGDDPELYWRVLLCLYCVEYQQDRDGSYKPIILYPNMDPCANQPEYARLFACTKSPGEAEHYRRMLDEIEETIYHYRNLRSEAQYDIFLSVRHRGDDGRYTIESDRSSDLYDHLVGLGFRVFNSRRYEIPAGEKWEPYIIAATLSSKVMIVLGSCPENTESRWVKNEWSRFQWLRRNDTESRRLICYLVGGMQAEKLPRELDPDTQAIVEDGSSYIKLENDLRRIFPERFAGETKPVSVATAQPAAGSRAKLLRAGIALKKGDWIGASRLYQEIVDGDPDCADGYVGLLCADLHLPAPTELGKASRSFSEDENYQMAAALASDAQRAFLENCAMEAEKNALIHQEENLLLCGDLPGAVDSLRKKGHAEPLAAAYQMLYRLKLRGAIAAGSAHTALLNENGSAVAVGNNEHGQCDIQNWQELAALSAGHWHTLGLTRDGRVLAAGDDEDGQCQVSHWRDVVFADAGNYHSIGLKKDGTLLTAGNNDYGQTDVAAWDGLVAAEAGGFHTVGLRVDGTVVAAGLNDHHQCDTRAWSRIVAVAAGLNHTVGLREDGTLVYAGDNSKKQCDVTLWRNVIRLAAGDEHTLGITAEYKALITGGGLQESSFAAVESWKDVWAADAGWNYTVALKKDGNRLSAGFNGDGQCQI